MRARAKARALAILALGTSVGCRTGRPVEEEPAPKKRVIVAWMSGPRTDVEGVHEEVKKVKTLLRRFHPAAQYQGSLCWLIWVDAEQEAAARETLRAALENRKLRYLHLPEADLKEAVNNLLISWGEPRNGLRLGLSPARVKLGAGEMSMRVRVSYETVGDAPREVPVHKAPGVNTYRLMFAGEKGGKLFYACALFERREAIAPGRKTLKPGERFMEAFTLRFPTGGLWQDGFLMPVTLKPGESLTLRAGVCARLDPTGAKEWNAPDTLRSGAITVARAAR